MNKSNDELVDDLPLILHLDNTTVHRLQFLLSKSLTAVHESNLEFLNTLHLLESLLLADEITIAAFEYEPSQIISNTLLGILDTFSDSLVVNRIKSDFEMQLEIAKETVDQLYAQNLLSFDPTEDNKLFTSVSVTAGRPSDVVEINAEFWLEIFSTTPKPSNEEIVDRAVAKVYRFRTDALFLFGVAHHTEFCNRLLDSYNRYHPWPDSHWNKLHVMFRSYFNQNLAKRAGAIYSPPPIRAITLENAHNKLITDIRGTIEDLPEDFLSVKNKELFNSISKGINFPIPLIGISGIPKSSKKDKNVFIDNFLRAREDTTELRRIIRKISKADSENNLETQLSLLKESYEIKREVAIQLNLKDPTVFPKKMSDIGFVRKYLRELDRFIRKENKTARFFSNLLLRMKDAPDLDGIKTYLED